MNSKTSGRKTYLLSQLNHNISLSLQHLAKKSNVSSATIRRDINELQAEGYVTLSTGIVSVNKRFSSEPSFQKRMLASRYTFTPFATFCFSISARLLIFEVNQTQEVRVRYEPPGVEGCAQLVETRRKGSAFNGQFSCACYGPLFCFNPSGELKRNNLGQAP